VLVALGILLFSGVMALTGSNQTGDYHALWREVFSPRLALGLGVWRNL